MTEPLSAQAVLEKVILPPLLDIGFAMVPSKFKLRRLGTGQNVAETAMVSPDDAAILVVLKWCDRPLEPLDDEVPFEIISLTDMTLNAPNEYEKVYLLLGGDGWGRRQFFLDGELRSFLQHPEIVTLMSLEGFVALANTGQL